MLENPVRDSIISTSFFSVVLSAQHLFSSLADYSHRLGVRPPQQLLVQMYRDRQTDNTHSSVYRSATRFLFKPPPISDPVPKIWPPNDPGWTVAKWRRRQDN